MLPFEYPREKVSKHRRAYACKTARSLQAEIQLPCSGFSAGVFSHKLPGIP
ncbi:hypothetical protein B4099_0880 [Heyndrickxia coagulans]|uniref:Uncharacterized protein n=1 Tax=Heyndrickxia coagulans TaxID=1398 RepID=A0A150KDN1_HEYCO|nr:hypothetical protein B4099_0880 [Heyndrickxia coagulans]